MTDIRSEYRGEFAVGEHSARHLCGILRLYLAGTAREGVAEAAGLALTELVANVVRHVPGRRCRIRLVLVAAVTDRWGVTVHRDGPGKTVWFECVASGVDRKAARR